VVFGGETCAVRRKMLNLQGFLLAEEFNGRRLHTKMACGVWLIIFSKLDFLLGIGYDCILNKTSEAVIIYAFAVG